MNPTMKHIIDFLAFIASIAGFVFTTIIPALASLAGLTWYGLRFYYFLKEKKNGNIKFD